MSISLWTPSLLLRDFHVVCKHETLVCLHDDTLAACTIAKERPRLRFKTRYKVRSSFFSPYDKTLVLRPELRSLGTSSALLNCVDLFFILTGFSLDLHLLWSAVFWPLSGFWADSDLSNG